MRVLHVAECAGGVLSLVRTYIEEQARRGHGPHLLAPFEAEIPGGKHHGWKVDRRHPAGFPRSVAGLRSVVHEVQPDVVHLHSFFAGLLGRLAPVAPPSTAVVYQPHSWAFDAVRWRALREPVIRWERLADRRTDLVVGNCQDELAEGQRHGVRTPVEVLGLPVDTHRFAPIDPDARVAKRQELGFDDRKVALCVGRLCRQKGQDLLVAAWEQAPVEDTCLVLVGSGDDSGLRRLAPRQWGRTIKAVGHQQDVRPWLWAADVLVQPSRYEGQSVAIAEALACGLPVLVSEVNGAREAVESGPQEVAGSVVSQGDMTALLNACRSRIGDPGRLAREAVAARQRAVELFAVPSVLDRVDSAYALAHARARARARQLQSTGNQRS